MYVRRWSREAREWLDLRGEDSDVLAGSLPSIAVSEDGGIFVCRVVNRFLRVSRWNGGSWLDLGAAPVDVVTLGADTWVTYEAQGCSLALTPAGRPVVAWSGRDGAKHHAVHVAQWGGGTWRLLGQAIGGDRATSAKLALDEEGRPYVVTFKPGGSYGGGNTTRVFRRIQGQWQELGDPRLNTHDPTIAVWGDWLYLALRAEDPGSRNERLHVFRTRLSSPGANWRELPGEVGAVSDSLPALAFRDDGTPVVAFVRENAVQVREHRNAAWRPVGLPITASGGWVTALELSISAADRASIAWLEQTFGEAATSSIRVWREKPAD